jgi:CheY-like chemotaxis protein
MKPVTILLAEENLVLGLFVKRVLQQAGYRVWFCTNLAEAWQYFEDKQPDLVLLDNNQPTKNNFTLACQIRTVNKNVPILFLSGKTFEEEIYKHNSSRTRSKQVQAPVLSEKNILQHIHDVLPVAVLHCQTAPAYDSEQMTLSTPEDILILTAYFEDSIYMRHFIMN